MSLAPSSSLPPGRDARSIITEDSFRVAPELLGRPLARPWRRACAMSVDGLLVVLLANTPGFLLALAGAVVLFRATSWSRSTGYLRRSARLMFRFSAAIVFFALLASSWDRIAAGSHGTAAKLGLVSSRTPPAAPRGADGGSRAMSSLGMTNGTIAFVASRNETEAYERAERLIIAMRRSGATDGEIRSVFHGFQEQGERPWLAAAADSALRMLDSGAAIRDLSVPMPSAAAVDSLGRAYAAALQRGDEPEAERLLERLAAAATIDEVSTLQDEVAARDVRIETLASELETAGEEMGLMAFLRRLAEDLGLGFGWAGLYFTSFVALWNGHTPGKRLMRVRIIRLDGKPVGWWMAFERFGGYAASLATGLLGFLQILWDRNRQGIHDRIAETVVVLDR